jgi:hypothetical protein
MPEEMVTVSVLQIISANAPAVVKLLVEPNSPKSTEKRKSSAKINPERNPAVKVLAPDHFITVVTNVPIETEQAITAHQMIWSSGLYSCFMNSGDTAGWF